jgi:hypothetical protein
MIATCTCKHDDQDKLHGAGKRVFNPTADGKIRCTVCGAEKGVRNE